jgi:hypothetical protein
MLTTSLAVERLGRSYHTSAFQLPINLHQIMAGAQSTAGIVLVFALFFSRSLYIVRWESTQSTSLRLLSYELPVFIMPTSISVVSQICIQAKCEPIKQAKPRLHQHISCRRPPGYKGVCAIGGAGSFGNKRLLRKGGEKFMYSDVV